MSRGAGESSSPRGRAPSVEEAERLKRRPPLNVLRVSGWLCFPPHPEGPMPLYEYECTRGHRFEVL
ncbi:MAG: hypothetical protein ACJ79W_26340, partial [Myxococcales bacterium]